MSRTREGRLGPVLAAALLLAALAVLAPPPATAAPLARSAPPGVVTQLWQWLQSLVAAEGGAIDPAGAKAVAAPRVIGAPRGSVPWRSARAAEGSSIDPLGGKLVSSPPAWSSETGARPRAQERK
jgi:hypothetical protein